MGAGPIEDAAVKATNGGDAGPKTVNVTVEGSPPPPQTAVEYFGSEEPRDVNPTEERAEMPSPKPEASPEEELIKAQHLFIEGLLNFIHDKSKVAQFAGEQEQYIRASMKYAGAKLDQK